MDQNTKDQILNLIDKSQSILLLTHAKADCDGLGSMISMYLTLQSLGKEVVAATNDPAPEVLGFLPSIHIVQNSVSSNNFVITLDISNTPLNKIKYKLAEDQSKVNIIVTPKSGHFKPEDVSFDREAGNFDLIITFDTGNLEHLGPIYDQNAELFFSTPVINIDHHASNTDYGQLNYVDVVAASTTEVMLGLLQSMEERYQKKFLTEDVATLLLAGLITDTGSFQHANTSPRAMEVAAKFLDLGARQQEIIKNIYKTKKLTTLKLWGTVLSKVETDPVYRLVWSSINKNDLLETGADPEESEGIIDDLLSNAPGAEIIMLFKYNNEGYVSVSMRSTTNSADVGKICVDMGGGGHVRAAGFKRRDGSSLEKLMEDTLAKAREYQGQRLNIHPDLLQKGVEYTVPVVEPTPPKPLLEAPQNPRPEVKIPESTQYLEFNAQKKEAVNPAPPVPTSQEPPKSEEKPQPSPALPPKENSPKEAVKVSTAPERKSIETLKKEFVSKPVEEKKRENSPNAQKARHNQVSQRSERPHQKSNSPENQSQIQTPPVTPVASAAVQAPAPATPVTPPSAPVETAEDNHTEEIPPAPAE